MNESVVSRKARFRRWWVNDLRGTATCPYWQGAVARWLLRRLGEL